MNVHTCVRYPLQTPKSKKLPIHYTSAVPKQMQHFAETVVGRKATETILHWYMSCTCTM